MTAAAQRDMLRQSLSEIAFYVEHNPSPRFEAISKEIHETIAMIEAQPQELAPAEW